MITTTEPTTPLNDAYHGGTFYVEMPTKMDVKPEKTFEEQLEILRGRGIEIEDDAAALAALQRINYYRLSAYTLTFKAEDSDDFKVGVTLSRVVRLYDFDHKLRHLLSAVLESTEIAFRDRVAYTLAHAFGPLGYRDAVHFRNPDHHGQFIAKLQDAIRVGQQQFIPHHMEQYDGNFPVWVAIELLSFGTLSKLYKNMHHTQQVVVASYYGSRESYLSTWVHAAVNLRNLCAHYDRLYNRHFPNVAKLPRDEIAAGVERGSLFASMLALRGVCPDRREWVSLVTGLQALIEEYGDVVELRYVGFPEDWRRRLLRPRPFAKS